MIFDNVVRKEIKKSSKKRSKTVGGYKDIGPIVLKGLRVVLERFLDRFKILQKVFGVKRWSTSHYHSYRKLKTDLFYLLCSNVLFSTIVRATPPLLLILLYVYRQFSTPFCRYFFFLFLLTRVNGNFFVNVVV